MVARHKACQVIDATSLPRKATVAYIGEVYRLVDEFWKDTQTVFNILGAAHHKQGCFVAVGAQNHGHSVVGVSACEDLLRGFFGQYMAVGQELYKVDHAKPAAVVDRQNFFWRFAVQVRFELGVTGVLLLRFSGIAIGGGTVADQQLVYDFSRTKRVTGG